MCRIISSLLLCFSMQPFSVFLRVLLKKGLQYYAGLSSILRRFTIPTCVGLQLLFANCDFPHLIVAILRRLNFCSRNFALIRRACSIQYVLNDIKLTYRMPWFSFLAVNFPVFPLALLVSFIVSTVHVTHPFSCSLRRLRLSDCSLSSILQVFSTIRSVYSYVYSTHCKFLGAFFLFRCYLLGYNFLLHCIITSVTFLFCCTLRRLLLPASSMKSTVAPCTLRNDATHT